MERASSRSSSQAATTASCLFPQSSMLLSLPTWTKGAKASRTCPRYRAHLRSRTQMTRRTHTSRNTRPLQTARAGHQAERRVRSKRGGINSCSKTMRAPCCKYKRKSLPGHRVRRRRLPRTTAGRAAHSASIRNRAGARGPPNC